MYGYYCQGVGRGVRARQCEFVLYNLSLQGARPFRAWHVTSIHLVTTGVLYSLCCTLAGSTEQLWGLAGVSQGFQL
jgi:hypothetical protein